MYHGVGYDFPAYIEQPFKGWLPFYLKNLVIYNERSRSMVDENSIKIAEESEFIEEMQNIIIKLDIIVISYIILS